MLEIVRRDSSTTYRPSGPLTPMSGEAEWNNSQTSSRSPDGEPMTDGRRSLTEPLSKLNITKDAPNDQINFWSSVINELDQLHSLMQGVRPLGPPPHADVASGFSGDCSGHPNKSSELEPLSHARQRDGHISFRGMAPLISNVDTGQQCITCHQNAGDKSVLLPGSNAARLATPAKLDIVAGIPTEAQSNVLFRAWLTSVFPAIPFMSIRHTFKKHAAFWDWKRSFATGPESTWGNVDLFFMPLLYGIWYSGTLSLSTRGFKKWFPGKSRAEMASHFHEQVIRYFSLVSFPSNLQAPLIGCLVLLQSIPAAEEEPVQSSVYINLMVKLAQTIGVHREPALYGVAPHEAEMRRRMWWQILRLDLSFASSTGYPSYIGEEMHDTRHVSEVYEAYIGSAEEKSYLQGRSENIQKPDVLPEPLSDTKPLVSVIQLVAKTTHIVALAMRKAVNMHMSTKVISKDALQGVNETINAAEEEVRDTIRRIPAKGVPELGFTPNQNSLSSWPLLECDEALGDSISEAEFSCYFGLPGRPNFASRLSQYHRQKLLAFNKWARITLSAMCDQMYCVAYVPFLKNARSKVWNSGRQCALHHCTSFLRKLISLATDPGLESYRWHWPGTLHPMHAVMIVLVDVYERPHSIEASRCRALVDKIFSLSDPANGIVGDENGVSTQRPLREGGRDAWNLLRDLRNSAWRKAGLDPGVLWTEEDQIKVGAAKPLSPGEKIMQSLLEDLLEPEDEADAFPQPHSIGSYPGLQYAMETYRQELEGTNGAAASEAVPEQLSSNAHGSRPLFRLPTQQRMPYPLTGYERPSCPGLGDHDDKEAAEVEAQRVLAVKEQAEAYRLGIAKEPTFAPSTSKHTAPTRSGQDIRIPGYFNVDASMGVGVGGVAVSSVTTAVSGGATANGKPHATASEETSSQNGDSQMRDIGEDFDWERWDHFFGQYSGFTDLMEMDTSEWEGAAPHG